MVSLKTVVIAGIQYLIHPHKLGSITATINPDAIIPVTLLTTEEIFSDRLEQLLAEFDEKDDVYTSEFASVLVEKVPENETASASPRDGLDSEVYQLDSAMGVLNDLTELPSGPYILHGPNLYQAWRLYEDTYEAFDFGVILENVTHPDEYRALSALSPGGVFKSIPVPSRWYFPPKSAKKPLSGVRLSVPDVVSLKGVLTTLSSRSWSALYSAPKTSTAEYAQRLMDLGAVIVGKTKVSPLASGSQWVDAQAPWNPRGDQYQRSSGSSAGAGAAMAGYGWIQHAVGEDAIGGIRDPGMANGVYSLRPSFANESLTGVQLSSSRYDSLGLAARRLADLRNLTAALQKTTDGVKQPRNIVFLDDLVQDLPKEQEKALEDFVKTIEDFLGTKADRSSLSTIWDENPPKEADGQKLNGFLKDAPFRSFCYDYASEYKTFRSSYANRFDREPFAEATTRFRWELGENTTESEYNNDLERIDAFKSWFESNILDTNSSTVVILPYGISEPQYRQDKPETSSSPNGLTPELLAPVLGAPHLVVPFTEISYESKVSGRPEKLPVSASILGPRGSDLSLVELVEQAFKKAKWLTEINTGRSAFSL